MGKHISTAWTQNKQIEAEKLKQRAREEKERRKAERGEAKRKLLRQERQKQQKLLQLEIQKLDRLIHQDQKELETEQAHLQKISETLNKIDYDIEHFDQVKEKELKHAKMDHDKARERYESDEKIIEDTIKKAGTHQSHVGTFLRLALGITDATLSTTFGANQLDSVISTFGDLMIRECNDKLTIENYFTNEKQLKRLISILHDNGFTNLEELKCKTDEEYNEIIAALEIGLQSVNNDKEDEKYEEVKGDPQESGEKLLQQWGLQRYWETMKEEGWDDPIDWKDLTKDDLSELGFKKGQIKKFQRKCNTDNKDLLLLKEKRLLKEICCQPETWQDLQSKQDDAAKEVLMSISPVLKDFFQNIYEGMKQAQTLSGITCGESKLNDDQIKAIKMTNDIAPTGITDEKEDNQDIEYEFETKNDEKKDVVDKILDDVRIKWQKGSKCQIYSESNGKWFNGEIIDIFKEDNEEWCRIKYGHGKKMKAIGRYSQWLRPIINDTDAMAQIAVQSRALEKASILRVDVMSSMQNQFNQNEGTKQAIVLAQSVQDCSVDMVKNMCIIRQSVMLAFAILKYKPAEMSTETRQLWDNINDGITRIFKTALDMVRVQSNYFAYFLRFKQSFGFYLQHNDKPLLISLEHLRKDISAFNTFQQTFTKTVETLSADAMQCVTNCLKTHIGAENFEEAMRKREDNKREWIEKERSLYEKEMELTLTLMKNKKKRIDLSAEQKRLQYKVNMLATRIIESQKERRSYIEMKKERMDNAMY